MAATLISPLSATWASLLASDGWLAVKASFARVARGVILTAPPVVVVGFLARRELVASVYHSHAYTTVDVLRTADVFGILLLSVPGQALIVAVSTMFIVRGNTIFPMKVAVANAVMNGVLDVVLRAPLGVTGIAISTTLTLTVLCLVYLCRAQALWRLADLRALRRPAVLSAASCLGIIGISLVLPNADRTNAPRLDLVLSVAVLIAAAGIVHAGLLAAAGESPVLRSALSRTSGPDVTAPSPGEISVRR
jgi:peptidoglycan biosynthesis protein MviN/MurJ (putative lipid II flippase)